MRFRRALPAPLAVTSLAVAVACAQPGPDTDPLPSWNDGADREWAYDRQSHIGHLDKAWDEAGQRGWTVVDMKQDRNRIFP